MQIIIPVGCGELYDKISILEIKAERITDAEKLGFVETELKELKEVASHHPVDSVLYQELKKINETLWDIEDAIREQEAAGTFSAEFIELARSVYKSNDLRAALKKKINLQTGSTIVEVKSYFEQK